MAFVIVCRARRLGDFIILCQEFPKFYRRLNQIFGHICPLQNIIKRGMALIFMAMPLCLIRESHAFPVF